MPALTDGQIKRAMKRVAASKKPETLTDGEGRGTGRLVLILKPAGGPHHLGQTVQRVQRSDPIAQQKADQQVGFFISGGSPLSGAPW